MMSNYFAPVDSFRVYPIHGIAGTFYLLYDCEQRDAVLLDTGLLGERPRLRRVLRELDLGWGDIRAILLTHGHLDHTGNLAWIKERSGAPILAHAAEQPHIDGRYPYSGPSRFCGVLEAVGRQLIRYRTVPIDRTLEPDEELPFWGGLRVIHLPGHTAGHCGFYSERFGLLFSGDLFAGYWWTTHLPPAFLNCCPQFFPASLRRVQALAPRLILPNHGSGLDGRVHRRRFDARVPHWLTALPAA